MLLLAVSALDKASKIPPSFWFKAIGGILVFLIAVVLLRKLFQVNRFILAMVCFVGFGIVGFSWIYNRNEPAFLTPFVDRIAIFFPTKNGYEIRQEEDPGTAGKKGAKPTATPTKAPRK